MRAVTVLALALGGLWLETSAAASPSAAKVRLSVAREAGAEACPSASALSDAVTARLGRNPFVESAEEQVEVTFHADASGTGSMRAEIRIRNADGRLAGERTLSAQAGSSCETLGAAAALAIALHIDPDAALSKPAQPKPTAEPLPSPSPPPPPAQPVPTVPAPPRSAGTQTIFEAGVGWWSEGLPGVSPVVLLGGGAEVVPSFWLRLSGMMAPEQRSTDRRFAFGLTAGFLGACYDVVKVGSPERGRGPFFSVAPCANLGFGELHAVVFTLVPTEPGTRLWVAGDVEALIRFSPVAPLDFELGLGAVAPFVRHRFYVIGETSTVFQQPPLVPIGKLTVGVHFF